MINIHHLYSVYQRIKNNCCAEWKDGKDSFYSWYEAQLAAQNGLCHYCHLPGDTQQYYLRQFRQGKRGFNLEVDRKDAKSLYSPSNCVLACYPCNNAKSDVFSYPEFLKVGKAIEKLKKSKEREDDRCRNKHIIVHLPPVSGSVEPTFRLFCGNYEQLAKALIFYESPESTALWMETQPNLNSFYIIEEIIRLLHNFAAGAMTLVDHTRNEANKLEYVPQLLSFRNEYNEEIQKRFEQNENHQLIQGLRNYMLHFSLVEGSHHWQWTRDEGEERTIRIRTGPLLKWEEWKLLARQKILRSGDYIIIYDLVEDYYDDVKAFNKWLWDWQGRMVNSHILPI